MRNGVARSIAAVIPATIASPGREPERSALEREVLDSDGDVLPLKLAGCDRDGVRRTGLRAIFLQTVRVAFDVAKFQWIGRCFGGGEFLVDAVVQKRGETGLGADRHVIAGTRHNHEIGLKILVEDQFAALGALDPKIFGRVAAQQRTNLRRHDV